MKEDNHRPPVRIVATIGSFDGVHRGHQHVLERVKSIAAEKKAIGAVLTFSPHPRLVIEGAESSLSLLSTTTEQRALLERYGIDKVITIPFNDEVRRLTAKQFVDDMLVRMLGITTLLVGYDHHIGSDRVLASSLKGVNKHIEIVELERIDIEATTVSSSVVRREIDNGDMTSANLHLGHPYMIISKVNSTGSLVGIPTRKSLPPTGEYDALVDGDLSTITISDREIRIDSKMTESINLTKEHTIEILKKR